MVRDAGYRDLRHNEPFTFWLLKFFPVAFFVTWDPVDNFDFPMQSLHHLRSLPYDAEVEIPLSLHPLPPLHWPESPTESSFILYGRDAINVKPAGVSKKTLARLGLAAPDD